MKTRRQSPLLFLALATALLAGCASPLRYVGVNGKHYSGTLDNARNTLSVDIDGKVYKGGYTVNQWGQGKAVLVGPNDDHLYCQFYFVGLKVRDGSCSSYSGRSYTFQGG